MYLSVVDSLMLPCFLLQYQTDEPVTLWVNKVGPYNNPQETYNYYSLPFCHPSENAAHKWGGLGEVLGGNELIDSQIDIKFQSMWTGCYLCILIYVVGLMDLFVFFFSVQKMWIGPPFVNLNLMIKRLNNSRMQLRIVTGLNSSWVCLA